MNNLKKIASLSLVLLAVLFNSPSSSVGATIFSDGFESGSFSAWTSSNGVWSVQNGGTHSGSKKAEAKGDTGENDDLLQKSVSTVGSQDIILSYWYKIAAGLESSDHIKVAWSTNGTTWNQVADYSNINTTNNYVKATHTLPAGANNNAGFRIRFSADLNSNGDQFWLDDVELSGTAIPTKGTLVVNKVVINDNGSNSTASDFSFSVNNASPISFEADGSNSLQVDPGSYSVVESAIPANYSVTYSADCTGTIAVGETKSCTITNNDKPDMCANMEGFQEAVPEGYHLEGEGNCVVDQPEGPSCNPEVNLIKNGGFETPSIPSGSYQLFSSEDTLNLEWLVDWILQPESATPIYPKLEIQNNIAGSPFSGSQHAELDSDAPVKIWQNIETIPGKTYTLNFHYSPRPGVGADDNSIEVKVNGALAGAVLSGDGSSLTDTSWSSETRTFVATGTSTKIEFLDASPNTSLGGYIDDVSLYCQNTQETPQGHVTVYKYTTGGDGTFAFSGIGEGFSLTTIDGSAVSPKFNLPASEEGTSYTVSENSTEGWTLTNSFCFKNSDIVVGKNMPIEKTAEQSTTFALHPEDDVSCVFFNAKDPVNQPTITVNKVVVGSQVPASEFKLYVDETQVTSGQTNVFSTGTHVVHEEAKPNFIPSFSGSCVAPVENEALINNVEDLLAKKFALEDAIAENPNDEGNAAKQELIADIDAKMVAILNNVSAGIELGADQNAVCTITNTYRSNPDENNTPPTITLVGSSDMTVVNGTSFVDLGATAEDTEDGNITAFIIATGTVNTSVNGDYVITYTVTDSGGLSASVSRTVRVVSRTGGGGGGGGLIPILNGGGSSGQGQVLGANTSCGLYLGDFLKYGKKNDKEEVKKLQTFLNDYLKLDPKITVNGIFGLDTKKAVIKFQEQENILVLKPWKLNKGTGYVYKTTVTRINNIMCPELNLQIPELN